MTGSLSLSSSIIFELFVPLIEKIFWHCFRQICNISELQRPYLENEMILSGDTN